MRKFIFFLEKYSHLAIFMEALLRDEKYDDKCCKRAFFFSLQNVVWLLRDENENSFFLFLGLAKWALSLLRVRLATFMVRQFFISQWIHVPCGRVEFFVSIELWKKMLKVK